MQRASWDYDSNMELAPSTPYRIITGIDGVSAIQPAPATSTTEVGHNDLLETSFALLRDAMDSFGRSSKATRIIQESVPQVGTVVHHVDTGRMDQHLQELEHSAIFQIATRSLWQSVCPAGIDMVVQGGDYIREPTKWFSDYIINTIWADELRMMMWSIMAVGFYAVTYSPSPEHPGILVPHVLHPREYTLWWAVDQHGQRYPRVVPRGLPLSPYNSHSPFARAPNGPAEGDGAPVSKHSGLGPESNNTQRPHNLAMDVVSQDRAPSIPHRIWQIPQTQFEAADVYVESWPTDEGEIRSRARSCIKEIVQLAQLQTDLSLLTNLRANMPVITQTLQPGAFMNRAVLGQPESRISASTFGASGSGLISGGLPVIPMQTQAEDMVGLHMFEYSARAASAAQVSQTLSSEVAQQASALATVPPLRTFDSTRNMIVTGTAPHAYRAGQFINLPPGVSIVPLPIADVPKTVIEERNCYISLICIALEVSPELILGTSSAHLSTSAITQMSTRASVLEWRKLLERRATMLYWRLFGEATLQPVFEMAVRSGVVVTPELAERTVMDFTVTFTFRSEMMTAAIAYEMYNSGVTTRQELVSQLMRIYGLPIGSFQSPSADPTRGPQDSTTANATKAIATADATERKQVGGVAVDQSSPFPRVRQLVGADAEDPVVPIGFAQ
jgi:hypothetical protein